MTTQPTPGPWEMSSDAVPDGYTQITVYAESDGERVATVFGTPANARLIKEAPAMLEALRQADTFLTAFIDAAIKHGDAEHVKAMTVLRNEQRNIIAQATGEE